MRTLKFRDILWSVAYKLGLDPEQGNFLTNQAIPIGTYIDQWVRRTYDARDWPELVVINKFAPVDHVVTWDAIPVGGDEAAMLGRILKVYLVDPAMTDAPVDTRFELTDDGVYCGLEHGTDVWIEYIIPPPRYTAEAWNPGSSYYKGQIVYSPHSGDCYRSKSDGNKNIDPSSVVVPGFPPIVETTDYYIPPTSGSSGQTKKLKFFLVNTNPPITIINPAPVGDVWTGRIYNTTGTIGTYAYTVAGSPVALTTVLSNLVADLTGSLPVGSIVTSNATEFSITIEHNSEFLLDLYASSLVRAGITYFPVFYIQQLYIPATLADPGWPQITQITMTAQTTVPGALYQLVFTDSSGVPHTVQYQSFIYDGGAKILDGLRAAIQGSSDPYLASILMYFDPVAPILYTVLYDNFSLHPSIILPESAWWEVIPFPKVLSEQVIRGAYGDLLKEWGQTDKGAAEEGAVPTEVGVSEGDFTTTPNPALTGQQAGLSRYKI